MPNSVEPAPITSGLDASDLNWEILPDNSYKVTLTEDGQRKFKDSLTETEDGSLTPVLEESLYNELVADAQKKSALEQYLREKSRITYEVIFQDLLAKQMFDTLNELIDAMEGDCFDEFLKDDEFNEAFSKLDVQAYADVDHIPKHSELCEFLTIFAKVANEKKVQFESEKDHNAKSYNSIKRSLDQIGLLYNYDIPKLAQGVSSIFTLKESKHIKKPQKKSWFRRFIDKIKVFFGKETQETLEQELHKLGSMEKVVTKMVGDSVAGSFNNNAQEHIKFLRANKESRQKRKDGERVNFTLPTTEIDEQKSAVASVSKMGVVKGAVKIAGMAAVAGIAAENGPFRKIRQYGVDEEVQATTFAEHINDAFTFEAKRQAFETMMQFTRDMYIMGDQLYAQGDDPSIKESMSLKALGFERLGEDGFSDFITRLSKSLGFDIEAYKKANPELKDVDELGVAVHLLCNADESMRKEAFKQFVAGNEVEGIGLQFASDAFNKEFNKMKSVQETGIADSDNYFYLLDLNKQVIEDLWMKSITKNAVHSALEQTGIEVKYYNPKAKGAKTMVTAALKEQLVSALPACMGKYMGSAVQKRELAQKMSASYCQGIKEEYDRRYEEVHPRLAEAPPKEKSYLGMANDYFWWFAGYDVEEKKSKSKSKYSKSPLYAQAIEHNKDKWEFAEIRVKEAGVPVAVRNELTEIVRKKTNKVWQKQAKHTTKTILDWGGMALLQDLYDTLTVKYAELQEQQAHPKLIAEVGAQLSVLAAVVQDYESTPDNFMRMELDEFKMFSDAIHSAVSIKYSKGNFANVDEQADMYMAMMALNQLNSIYLTSEIALRLYEDVLPTDFDEIPTGKISATSKLAIDKVAEISDEMLKDAMSGPIKQFEYFAEQRQHALSGTPLSNIADESEQSQSWLSWGASTAWSLFSGTASFSANAISRYTNLPLAEVKTSEELNKILVDSTQEYIRGEFFDSSGHVVMELYNLIRYEEKFEYLQGLIGDKQKVNPFSEYGFGNKEDMLKFIDELSQDLGFDNAKELYQLKTSEGREDVAKLETLKSSFSGLRKTEDGRIHDPFVSAKLTIRAENQRLINKSQKKGKKKLKNSANYMVVMSSLDAMAGAVELAQRETLAVELLMPEADKILGLGKDQVGLWDTLVAAGEQRAKEYGNNKLRQGVAAQLSDSITRAKHFPTAMIHAVANNLDNKLAQAYSATVIEEEVIDEFIAKTSSTDKVIEFFEQQIDENIQPYVLNALIAHMIQVNQPEFCHKLLALEKRKLGEVDELEFWQDLLTNAFAEQNHKFAATIISEHIPDNLKGDVISKIVNNFEDDAKISMDVMMTILLLEPEKLSGVHVNLIYSINHNCGIEYDKTITDTKRGWSQMVSDNDGAVLDDIREIYVFMDNLRQQFEKEMIHIQEELEALSEPTELTRLKIQAHANKLESYEKVLGEFENIKYMWMNQNGQQEKKDEEGNYYTLSNYPLQTKARREENIPVWDAEVSDGLEDATSTLEQTRQALDKAKKKFGVAEKPDLSQKLEGEPKQKRKAKVH